MRELAEHTENQDSLCGLHYMAVGKVWCGAKYSCGVWESRWRFERFFLFGVEAIFKENILQTQAGFSFVLFLSGFGRDCSTTFYLENNVLGMRLKNTQSNHPSRGP